MGLVAVVREGIEPQHDIGQAPRLIGHALGRDDAAEGDDVSAAALRQDKVERFDSFAVGEPAEGEGLHAGGWGYSPRSSARNMRPLAVRSASVQWLILDT